jgi:hypothetical protein
MTKARGFSRALKYVVLAACLGTLSACSAVRVAYKQLDWVIEKQVGEYVTLEKNQQRLLESHIEALLDWHCRTQVHGYAQWLRQLSEDFQHTVTTQQLRGHSQALEAAWFRIMARSIPALADLAGSLSDQQVSELIAGLERDNKAYRKDYVDPPQAKLREDSAKWMAKSLKRWLGPLTEGQKQAVGRWSRQLVLMGETGWQNRQRWQQELAGLLALRHNRETLVAGLERLLLHWRDYQDTEYSRRYDVNSELTAGLLVQINLTMTSRQKARMDKKSLRYASDLDSLHCGSGEPRSSAARETRGLPVAAN